MTDSQQIQIAIDGPVAAGKGTAAKRLAQELGCLYVDTGAMYRAATLLALESGLEISPDHQDELAAALRQADFELLNTTDQEGNFFTLVKLNGRDVSGQLRDAYIEQNVSKLATLPLIREILVAKQQDLARSHSVVMEGRDIGTRVLPAADFKIYLTASLAVRAQRRFAQQHDRHPELTLAMITDQIRERDARDSGRASDPLQIAPGAVVYDTSEETIDQTVAKLLAMIRQS